MLIFLVLLVEACHADVRELAVNHVTSRTTVVLLTDGAAARWVIFLLYVTRTSRLVADRLAG